MCSDRLFSRWREHVYKAFFALFFLRCLQKSEYFEDQQGPVINMPTKQSRLLIRSSASNCALIGWIVDCRFSLPGRRWGRRSCWWAASWST